MKRMERVNRLHLAARALLAALLFGPALTSVTLAGDAPDLMNYQGVLRDASDAPLDGSHDMVFRFYTAQTGGDEIMVDTHNAANGNPVTVSGGLFNVTLGGGAVTDGSGPGIYISLRKVFKVHQAVYLGVEVGGEMLTPRVRIIAAAYAMNASYLAGRQAGEFLDTSSSAQTKQGPLMVDASSASSAVGVEGHGQEAGGYFLDSDASGYAYIGHGHYGIRGFGDAAGGYFRDLNSSGYAYVGYGDYGLQGYGNRSGGYFKDLDQSGRAYIGYGHEGVRGLGNAVGGYFEDSDQSGHAYVGYGDDGLDAYGDAMGGYFGDSNDSGAAWLGYGDLGIKAVGNEAGGYFYNHQYESEAWLANELWGIEATGVNGGALLSSKNDSGFARIGWGDEGVFAMGEKAGGEFRALSGSGKALVGYGDLGIEAEGLEAGGYFSNMGSLRGYAFVGYGDEGIAAHGFLQGGYFQDEDSSGQAHVAYGDRGIWAVGTFSGGTFSHPDEVTFWADVATPTHKIKGTGAVSFVQNHPYDESRVIVYSAPEGDEVAVYTRGTARLVGGEARVVLGETFRWVTNPDIGLTAYLTPRGEWSNLYVASVTTDELVVRAVDGPGDGTFDYIVYGLRLGFETSPVVEVKQREALLPTENDFRSKYREQPDLRSFNAAERFRSMVEGIGGMAPDMSGAAALRQAVVAAGEQSMGRVDPELQRAEATRRSPEDAKTALPRAATAEPGSSPTEPILEPKPVGSTGSPRDVVAAELSPASQTFTIFPVSELVATGELLVLDLEHPGKLCRASAAADPNVVGVAAAQSTTEQGQLQVPVLGTGFAEVHADASYGAIFPGDLLVSSATPGHAMTAAGPLPGTVIGKALESLESGRGLIKILVMPR